MASVRHASFAMRPYEWDGVVVLTPRQDWFVAFVRRKLRLDIAVMDGATARLVFWSGGHPWALWLPDLMDMGVVAHECFHVVSTVLRSRGVQLCEDSEEAYSYSLGHLMGDILNRKRWTRVTLA